MKKIVFLLNLLFCSFFAAKAQQAFNMTQVARWDDASLPVRDSLQYNDCWGFEKSGREYAVIGSLTKTHFIEVTNTPTLTEVLNFTNGGNSLWRDYKYYKGYIYGVADEGSEGLRVYNVNNINATSNRVSLVHSNTTTFLRCHNVWIDTTAGRLYCAGTNTKSDGIIVFDIKTNPASPTLCASLPLRSTASSSSSGYVHDVHVDNGKMYCSHIYTGRMDVYNIATVNSWVTGNATLTTVPRLGFIKVPGSGYNHSSYLTEDKTKLIMAEETHGRPLTIVDVSNPASISALGTIYSCTECPTGQNTPSNGIGSLVHNPFVKGNLAFLAYYHEGLAVYDISNPSAPTKVAYFDTDYPNRSTYYADYYGAWGTYPYLSSGKILVSDILNGLFVVNLNSNVTQVSARKMKSKVKLSGMDAYLGTTTSFPLSDPYKTPAYNSKFVHVNNNTTATTTSTIVTANQVVDWVFLELRTGISGATTVVQTRSALLRLDGNIVDMDGVSPVSFPGAAGNYYITVRHRTHLGFRSANVLNINGTAPVLNFSNNSIPVYGVAPFTSVNGNNVMVGGDANADGSIDGSDSAIWEIQNGLFQNTYNNTADFNLDGSVDSIDSAIWEINNGKYEELD
jgi:choice-of-anchor B domain-containing protein